MKIKTNKSEILKALYLVSGSVDKKGVMPILANVMIEAKGGKVHLVSTDLSILTRSNFDCFIEEEGKTTVPAQIFLDIIKKAPVGEISIIQESPTILQIKSGKSRYKLPCLDAAIFPELSEDEFSDEIEINAQELSAIIKSTSFAISNDETRYYLNGLCLQALKDESGSKLYAVATDGHRLAISSMKIDFKDSFKVIIPKKSVIEIKKIIDNSSNVKLLASSSKIKIIADQSSITSKLIEGDFPDYNKVIPKNNDKIVTINKKIFFDCINRVSTVSTDNHRSVGVTLANNKMSMQVDAKGGLFAYEESSINYSSGQINIGFNSHYLLDVIAQIEDDELVIFLKDNNSPILIESQKMNSQFVIMPVRI